MFRMLSIAMSALLLAGTPAFANNSPSTVSHQDDLSPLAAEQALADDAQQKYENEDYAGAHKVLDALVASPSFAMLTDNQRYNALYHLGWLQINDNDRAAHDTFKRVTAMTEFAAGEDWHLRLRAASIEKDDADALSDQYIHGLVRRTRLRKDLVELRFELLLALKAGFWRPPDAFDTAEYEWVELVRELLERGRVQEAQAVAESIGLFDAVNEMVLEKQFDPVTQAAPARFDLRNAMDRELDELREAVMANPNRLEGVNELAHSLTRADQPGAALQLLDVAIARTKQNDGSAKAFSDPGQLNWTYNYRALALLHLGRVDEAIALMKLGAARPEDGLVNVSQQLNLAQIYEEEGRAAEAMTVIADGDTWDLSPYGKMDFQGVRTCAAAQLHDQAHMQQSLSYIRAHVDDAPGWAIDAFVCAGDPNSAAKIVISELADPYQRRGALADLQEGPLDPSLSSIVRARKLLMWALYQRPDVKAAADAVGHHVPSPLQVWGMGR
jgi:hypothetical protein